MSNPQTIRLNRNLKVLLARAMPELRQGGIHIAHVAHDTGYPSLRRQSMLACICQPELPGLPGRP